MTSGFGTLSGLSLAVFTSVGILCRQPAVVAAVHQAYPPSIQWSKDKMKLFLSHGPSLVHSCLASYFVVRALWKQGSAVFDDLLDGEVAGSDISQPLSLGYFGYDTVAMLTYYLKRDQFMLVHHTACMLGCTIGGTMGKCRPFLLLAMLAEPNSVFLHTRTILRMMGIVRGFPYQIVLALNYVSFVMFRILAHGLALFLTYSAIPSLPPLLGLFGSVGGSVLYGGNWKLLMALLKADTKTAKS